MSDVGVAEKQVDRTQDFVQVPGGKIKDRPDSSHRGTEHSGKKYDRDLKREAAVGKARAEETQVSKELRQELAESSNNTEVNEDDNSAVRDDHEHRWHKVAQGKDGLEWNFDAAERAEEHAQTERDADESWGRRIYNKFNPRKDH